MNTTAPSRWSTTLAVFGLLLVTPLLITAAISYLRDGLGLVAGVIGALALMTVIGSLLTLKDALAARRKVHQSDVAGTPSWHPEA
ncbi:hypothetical protein [Nakamurella lactea]|uniref:hypothetical protein n=1 Tax=Nakamurella lactea TaxID=459515 RepID=UPI0004099490|nr:hypothetical protein [Nakamurella lactea]